MQIDATKAGAKLAPVLLELGKLGDKTDALATRLLRIVRDESLRTPATFSAATRAAYKANGWHSGRGRPTKRNKDLARVPASVRIYVWEIKAALKAGLHVWKYTTLYQMRIAMAKRREREAEQHRATRVPAELVGVRITQPDTLTGALGHDVAVILGHLKKDQRALFSRQLEPLVKQWAKEVKTKQPAAVEAEPERKVANA